MRTVLFLPFTEPDGVAPSDRQGTLDDLGTAAGLDRPTRAVDPTWSGGGHRYAAAAVQGWLAADAAGGDSLLQRDVTIQALVVLDLGGATGPATLVCRGLDGSASEYYGWGLELEEQAGNPGYVEVRWLWQDRSGNLAGVLPGVYEHPGDGVEVLITATRRWVSTNEVVVRYYVGPELVGEHTTTDGEIGGGTTGHTSVGARKAGGSWTAPWSGVIDQIKVTDYEMSGEEVAAVWDRMTRHQPDGVAALRALEPPGAPWSRDPSSRIGRLLTAAGQGLGMAAAAAEELRRNALPHRAYADTIGRWEALVGTPSNPRLSLDTRRTRVVAQLSRDTGYAPPQIRQALSGPFDLDAADVELVELGPTVSDGFATLSAERWHAEPAAGWTIVTGALQLSRGAGADITGEGATCRMALDNPSGAIVQAKLATYWAALPLNTIVGLFLLDRVTGDELWWGVRNDGGTRKLGYQHRSGGVAGAFTAVVTPATDAAYYLRIVSSGAGDYSLAYSTDAFDLNVSSVSVSGAVADPRNAGVGALCTDAALASSLVATFDDFLARTPEGDRGFHWYALRDPLLGGNPDMLGAAITVKTIKPAHTYAYAITSRSLLCDDDASVCDGGPMGAL